MQKAKQSKNKEYNLFLGKVGTAVSLVAVALIIISAFTQTIFRFWIWTSLIFLYSLLNLLNYIQNRRGKFLITGSGLIVLSIASALSNLYIIFITWTQVWILFFITVAFGHFGAKLLNNV